MPSNRRTTLGGAVHNNRKSPSNDLHETSPKKKKGSSRMSMMPRMPGAEPLLSTKPSAGTPSRKRQSLGVGRNDPRPMTDKGYQTSCMRGLLRYLNESGYEHPVSMKILNRPSGKDFNQIMTFLLRRIDPNFNDGTMRFEDEVPIAFKALDYPFSISKTALVAAGSPHTWPALLAALSWLVELLVCRDEEEDETDSLTRDESAQPLEPDLNNMATRSDRAFFRYLTESYQAFLSGQDDLYEVLEEQLIEYFERDNMTIEQMIERLTDRNASVFEEINQLSNIADHIPESQREAEHRCHDLEKYQHLAAQLKQQRAALKDKINSLDDQLQQKQSELRETNESVQKLQHTISHQEYSTQDIQRIAKEIERIQLLLQKTTQTKLKHKDTLHQRQIQLRQRLDELKNAAHTHNTHASHLNLGSNNNGNKYKFHIQLHKDQAIDLDQSRLLGGVYLKGHVLPALSALKDDLTRQITHSNQQLLQLSNQKLAAQNKMAQQTSRTETLRTKIQNSNQEFQKQKDSQEASLALLLREISSLETKISSTSDPISVEAAIASYRTRLLELQQRRDRILTEGEYRKKLAMEEIQTALGVCAEHKEYFREAVARLIECLENKVDGLEGVRDPRDVCDKLASVELR